MAIQDYQVNDTELAPANDDWFTQFGGTTEAAPTPWSGAPPNNPTAAPEQGYWGADMNTHPTVQTPAKEKFEDYFQNYWAPDRAQVLASLRYQNPTTTATGSTTTGGSTVSGNANAFRDAWLASGGRTVQDLQNFINAHPEFGAKTGGSKGDKVYGPNGEYWADAVIAAGEGGKGASWQTDTGGGGGGSLGGLNGAFVQPFGGQYKLPSLQDLQNMPGYQAGLDAFTRSGLNSLAARGTLGNRRSQEALGKSISDYGMLSYGTLAGLGKGEFETNRDIFYHNQDSPFDKWYRTATLGQPR